MFAAIQNLLNLPSLFLKNVNYYHDLYKQNRTLRSAEAEMK